MERTTAYLSDKVHMYRYRWLEEYYRAENLKHHMPHGIHVPEVPWQIQIGTSSPRFSPYIGWEDIGSEWGEHSDGHDI